MIFISTKLTILIYCKTCMLLMKKYMILNYEIIQKWRFPKIKFSEDHEYETINEDLSSENISIKGTI